MDMQIEILLLLHNSLVAEHEENHQDHPRSLSGEKGLDDLSGLALPALKSPSFIIEPRLRRHS